jgi:nitrate/nitrite transporter NarK
MIVISRYAIDRFSASPGVAGLAAGIFVIGGLVGRLLGGRAMTRVSQTKTLYAGVLLSLG